MKHSACFALFAAWLSGVALFAQTTTAELTGRVTDASGSAVRRGEVAAPCADRSLDVYFPGKLAEGRYQLVIRENKGGRELARSAFDVIR